MKITYLGHSGFLVETGSAVLVFDYVTGELPDFDEKKPVYVFMSHAHSDHCKAWVFSAPGLAGAKAFILGFDIKEEMDALTRKNPDITKQPLIWAYPQETIETEDFTCEPILSTDEGVAFLVKTAYETIYHAGDLNWWHWNGDPDEQNLERARNFKREIDRMKGVHIDAAFVPLDSRQEDAYRFCMDYCMETLDADHVFPMHFWKNYDLCHAYSRSIQESHPAWYQRFIPISHLGQQFDI